MSPLARIRLAATCGLLLSSQFFLASVAQGADPPAPATQAVNPAGPAQPPPIVQLAPNATAQLARSALLTVQASVYGDTLRLGIERNADKSPITGEGVTVSVGGKSQTVSRTADGYEIAIDDLRDGEGRNAGKELEVVVPHDGIREIVSGRVALAQDRTAGESLLRDHRQIAWWIVNIVVVLIAALAISRRKG
jgi:hypothetical protein